ncbi:hypothetical protein [Brevundimonas mediterranea]|uniref:Uncharacterized protein n=1 Tax=Brevundimonas mediterranea TaxID=74329 RepID=A0A7W6A4V5_9CAUL|nr:hypothetical protein [Brevundimonas mediterranea]MBB3871665.1 hypothetical protein [Brevundimonas mediterranea]
MTKKNLKKAADWKAVKKLAKGLAARRPGDTFLAIVLDGAIRVGRDAKNPIRGNLLGAACREALTHLLHVMAPDREVRACQWFVQAEDTETVTRAQRADYIARGGLSSTYVEKTLGLSRKEYVRPLNRAIALLNKLTHVKPDTVVDKHKPVVALAQDIFEAMGTLLDAADDCRKAVAEALREAIDEQVMDRMISETIAELDELSTHTFIDEIQVEDISVVEIGPEQIHLEVEGVVYVTLQYGSGSDVRRGDGATMDDSYPFEATVIVSSIDPEKFEEVREPRVDNRSFYE